MKTAAIIKRASQQARNAMQQLDAGGVADLLEIYTRAADEVRAAIRSKVGADDAVPREQLAALLRQIEDIVTRLGTERDAALVQAIGDAATLGVRPFTTAGAMAVGGVAGTSTPVVLESGAAMKISQAAVDFVMNFRAADGLTLSDRLWRMDQGAKEVLSRAVSNAVVQGWSGARAAQDLALRGVAIPQDVAGQIRGAKADKLVGLADLLTSSKSGAEPELWKAERVLRTEINRAHGEAYMAGAEKTPGFAGFQFLLSPRHPKPDICDLLASQNVHGLGPGVYPTRAQTPWPAHPNTLSFVVMVFEEDITEADRAGKETELQALARLAPEVRAGAVGVTKAAYFDQGLLTRGAIRSPLRAVSARLARQGAL